MASLKTILHTLAIGMAGALLVGASALARAGDEPPSLSEVHAKGEKCVQPGEVMRKRHYEFILHQRHETMHEGIRTPRYSLKQCIDCHEVDGADGKPVTIASPKHFCNSCHTYAAVKIDCFECHSSVPAPTGVTPENISARISQEMLNAKTAEGTAQ